MQEEGANLASDTMLDNQQLVFTEGQRPLHIHVWQSAENPLYNGDIPKRDYTHLTPPSNSWWINNTEFGEEKGMLRSSLCLREEVSQL